ncbi:MAG: hypothetical protein AB1638_00415 [Nitrospirota bacterium]
MKRNNLCLVIVLIIILMYLWTSPCYSLETSTHMMINQHIAENMINNFSLNDYLEKQLGFEAGIKEYLSNGSEKKMTWEWIRDAGETEDVPQFRSGNHFHDPISNKGFDGVFLGLLFKGDSSIIWSQKPIGTQNPGGYYSWFDARDYFYKALTSKTKNERDSYFAETFRAVGQLMHLVQDASVPAHTRNDPHPLGFHYEKWVGENYGSMLSNLPAISFEPSILSSSNFLASLPISNIIDTEHYNGTNPEVTASSNAIGISEYSNANFFSEDTIFMGYPHPKKEKTDAIAIEQQAEDGEIDKPYYVKGYQSEKLAAYSYFNRLDISGIPEGWKYNLDGVVYDDYARKLIPRAVGYSAGLLSYFLRGDIDLIKTDQFNSYKIRNMTSEDMNGKFEVYHDDETGQRRLVGSWQGEVLSNSEDGLLKIEISECSQDILPSVEYILVFKGEMGNEAGAVVGHYGMLRPDSIKQDGRNKFNFVANNLIENQYNCSLVRYSKPTGCTSVGWALVTAKKTSSGERNAKLYYDGESILLEENSVPVDIESTGIWSPHGYYELECEINVQSLESLIENECPTVWNMAWAYGSNTLPLSLNLEDGSVIYSLHNFLHAYEENIDIFIAAYSFGYATSNMSGNRDDGPYECYFVINDNIQQKDTYMVFIVNSNVSKIKLGSSMTSSSIRRYSYKINGEGQVPGTEEIISIANSGKVFLNISITISSDGNCCVYSYEEWEYVNNVLTFVGKKKFLRNLKTGVTTEL